MKSPFYYSLLINLIIFLIPSAVSFAFSPANLQRQAAPEIADELSYTTDFVRFLQSDGMSIRKVARSHWEGTFKGENKAAFVETDRGVVEVVIFAGPADAERIRITSYMTSIDGSTVRYKYKLEGLATNGDASRIDAGHPLYFTMYKNWFMVTTECDLDREIKRGIARR